MVLSVHVNGYIGGGMPPFVHKFLGMGAYGVALYFLLSGYFAFPSVNYSCSLKMYFKKKIVRILPMYYVSLGLTFIIGVFVVGKYPLDVKWITIYSF